MGKITAYLSADRIDPEEGKEIMMLEERTAGELTLS